MLLLQTTNQIRLEVSYQRKFLFLPYITKNSMQMNNICIGKHCLLFSDGRIDDDHIQE
jgi:hypothetical protein